MFQIVSSPPDLESRQGGEDAWRPEEESDEQSRQHQTDELAEHERAHAASDA
jgi:hypothetical protein